MTWRPSQGAPRDSSQLVQKMQYENAMGRHAGGEGGPTGGGPGTGATLIGCLFIVGVAGALIYGAFQVGPFAAQTSPSEKPDVQTGIGGLVSADSLNVRAGPTTDAPVVGELTRGAEVRLRCEAIDGWIQLENPYKGAYVSGRYVDEESGLESCF